MNALGTSATLLAVSRCFVVKPDGPDDVTGIDKRPVDGPVRLERLGVEGDSVLDTVHHGGPDKAVYVYAVEDLRWWAGMLGRDLPPGAFGENLTTEGLDVTGAVVGERWRIGGALLEVRQPRIPCATFQRHLDERAWVRRFTEHGAPGAYCAVLEEGAVRAGDRVDVVHVPAHGVTLGEVFLPRESDAAARARLASLAAVDGLALPLQRALARTLGRTAAQAGPAGLPVDA
ncbi:MAG TPA: MOSC domain-containing protein [Motilibacteraceae bacterium]|nr:MOSC domain-containing protein [Motilibacteraceae bacterium]